MMIMNAMILRQLLVLLLLPLLPLLLPIIRLFVELEINVDECVDDLPEDRRLDDPGDMLENDESEREADPLAVLLEEGR